MLAQLKALLVVLALATAIFVIAKPVWLRFTKPEDFARRRMVWYLLTIVGFASTSFWLYAVIAAPVIWWAAKKDSTPLALFLFLVFVVPPVSKAIPVVGIKQLFDMSNWRLLVLVILLPPVLLRLQAAGHGEPLRLSLMDLLLLLFGALQLVLFMPYESLTNTMRRGFLFVLDTYLVFFAFSRLLSSRRALTDAMGALCLSACIMALLGVFESLRSWLLYTGIAEMWGDVNEFAWLLRGDSLRAQVATGHAITFGYMMALAIGCWMYLKELKPAAWAVVSVFGLMMAGLLVSYSRGAWVMAALMPLIFMALGSGNAANLAKGLVVLAVVAAAVMASPLGSTIAENLPFIGTQDQGTVEYRQQLAETSWTLIKQNPLLGNPFVLINMEELRQNQGIIDIVNAYLQVALFYGLVGAGLFVGVYLAALQKAHVRLRAARASQDTQLLQLGACLIACMVANLVFIGTAGHSWLQWAVAGLLASYASLQPESNPVPEQANPDSMPLQPGLRRKSAA